MSCPLFAANRTVKVTYNYTGSVKINYMNNPQEFDIYLEYVYDSKDEYTGYRYFIYTEDYDNGLENLTDYQVKFLQALLADTKYYTRYGITGVFDEKTENAIKHYQKDNGLEVTGQPSYALVEALLGENFPLY